MEGRFYFSYSKTKAFSWTIIMDYSVENKKKLILGIQSGNEAAYKVVYFHYYEPLCIYVLSFTSHRTIAEDVVQDVFLKLWAKRESLRLDGSLNGYLYRLTYNTFIDVYRENKQLDVELQLFKRESLAELIEENDEQFQQRLGKVQKAIDELPPRCKEIFILCKQRGMRYKEIAKKMGVSLKTVENQMGKALSLIRKKVKSKLVTLLFLLQRQLIKE